MYSLYIPDNLSQLALHKIHVSTEKKKKHKRRKKGKGTKKWCGSVNSTSLIPMSLQIHIYVYNHILK